MPNNYKTFGNNQNVRNREKVPRIWGVEADATHETNDYHIVARGISATSLKMLEMEKKSQGFGG